jgi:predicted nucleic acid-binding protein
VIAGQRGFDSADALELLRRIGRVVEPVDKSLFEGLENEARQRIDVRDTEDWPVVATALRLAAPIWTEDLDFFGTGITTWTSNRVELFLKG